jgi:hypothetical protein
MEALKNLLRDGSASGRSRWSEPYHHREIAACLPELDRITSVLGAFEAKRAHRAQVERPWAGRKFLGIEVPPFVVRAGFLDPEQGAIGRNGSGWSA